MQKLFARTGTLALLYRLCQLNDAMSFESQITAVFLKALFLSLSSSSYLINELPERLRQANPRIFADDTNLTTAGDNLGKLS